MEGEGVAEGAERGDCAGFAISPYPGNVARDTSVQRYLLTLPRNCPRFRDLHGIRSNFTAKLLLRRGGQRGGKAAEECGERVQPLCPLRVPEV